MTNLEKPREEQGIPEAERTSSEQATAMLEAKQRRGVPEIIEAVRRGTSPETLLPLYEDADRDAERDAAEKVKQMAS